MSDQIFVARLIEVGRVCRVIEFPAPDQARGWVEANDGVDPVGRGAAETRAAGQITAHVSRHPFAARKILYSPVLWSSKP